MNTIKRHGEGGRKSGGSEVGRERESTSTEGGRLSLCNTREGGRVPRERERERGREGEKERDRGGERKLYTFQHTVSNLAMVGQPLRTTMTSTHSESR